MRHFEQTLGNSRWTWQVRKSFEAKQCEIIWGQRVTYGKLSNMCRHNGFSIEWSCYRQRLDCVRHRESPRLGVPDIAIFIFHTHMCTKIQIVKYWTAKDIYHTTLLYSCDTLKIVRYCRSDLNSGFQALIHCSVLHFLPMKPLCEWERWEGKWKLMFTPD